jgi:dihydrofolate synthase/folylpolyglutamate synthase
MTSSTQQTLSYLYSLHKFGMKFGLRNIRILLRSVDHPQTKFKTIHIAGTNGKGSTSAMIAAIFTAAGYKVGLYTSPHLVKFNERIRINGVMISDADVVKYTRRLKPYIRKIKATFFEATTAMAFRYFADQKVDIAVIETGLGGRLDSTNVIKPIVSVITSIGKDHVEQLGNTLSSIAAEKAGIIKSHIPVILGNITGTALSVIAKTAKRKHAPLLYANKIRISRSIHLALKGVHQISNAQCAIAAVTVSGGHFVIGDKAIRQGLEHTTKYTGLRARLELLSSKPALLLDVAHNPSGIKQLVSEIKKLGYKKIVFVFAVMRDKNYRLMGKELARLNPIIVLTQPNVERALPLNKLYGAFSKLRLDVHSRSPVEAAVLYGKQLAGSNGLLVVTGSHYLVGEVIEKLQI